jgi:hypothetical protein
MSPRVKRFLLLGYLVAVLLLFFGMGYVALRHIRADIAASEQAVTKKPPVADVAALPGSAVKIKQHVLAIQNESPPSGPMDNIEPIREQQYRELHEPLYKMNPRDK